MSPTDGSVVSTFSFPITVTVGSAGNPSTLYVELNGQDITSQLTGGPTNFSVTMNPGAPLLDHNTLVVKADSLSGTQGGTKTILFDYLPPKARVDVVTNQSECPTGPLAHCKPGDFLMANTEARFVIQGDLQRDLKFTGTYGGNLIDAETVVGGVPQGNDNFFEFQPMVSIEQTIHATSVVIVNDGQDGTTAIVRSCGPDDLLDDINPSSQVAQLGATVPANLDDVDYNVNACTEYRLNPQTRVVEVETTIENLDPDPLSVFPGDFVNAGGQDEQYTPISSQIPGPTLRRAGVGETLTNYGIRAMSFYGYGQAQGVDYALVFPQVPEVSVPSSSFTTSGVSFVMHGQTIPQVLLGGPSNYSVPGNGTNSFRRWFEVGDGSGANAIEAMVDVIGMANESLSGCVREAVTNAPIVGARVVAREIITGPPLRDWVRSHWVTDANGCYSGRVPLGTYQIAAAKEGYPYEGNGATPTLHSVTLNTAGGSVVQDVMLPQTGRLHVTSVDHNGDPVPSRLGVVGFDPSPEINQPGAVILGSTTTGTTNVFYDRTADGIPTGLTRTAYSGADGVFDIALEPGTYQVAVSRGTEWSDFTQQVTITAGNTTNVAAQIAHVLDTPGAISADYHVHLIDSPDSRVSYDDRIRSYAGEGVDDIIATDHAWITDLDPKIAALGLTPFVNSTIGEEITSFDYGHFNAYPQAQDNTRTTHGSTDHAGAAPVGEDFPIYGNYNLSPAQIEAAAIGKPQNAGLETVVQINHINSHFTPLRIDTSLTPPQSNLDPLAFNSSGDAASNNPLFFRLDPNITNFFHHFAALELWNGYTIGQQGEFLVGRIGIWMNHLNQGLFTTAISDTDSHELVNLRSGGARSWTPSSTDSPAGIVDAEIARAVRAGKMVGGQGLYVQTRLLATDGSGGVASLLGTVPAGTQPATAAAGTLVTVTNGAVDLEIRVQAPTWAPYDTIEIYRNASTQVTGSNCDPTCVPTEFTSVPTTVLTAGTDFTVSTVPVNGSQRLETLKTVSLTGLAADEWIVVVVKGTSGVSAPMFPVMTDGVSLSQNPNLAALMSVIPTENGIRALGVTNALYVDVDQNGVFDPPGVSVVP